MSVVSVRDPAGFDYCYWNQIHSSFYGDSRRGTVGEQERIDAVCRPAARIRPTDLVHGVHRRDDESPYVSLIRYSTDVHDDEVCSHSLVRLSSTDAACRAFRKACNDVFESRRAINNLNTQYADLTAEELAAVADTTCIICREDMQAQQSIKRLACQHIFHKNCLRSWFQRQQTCELFSQRCSVRYSDIVCRSHLPHHGSKTCHSSSGAYEP